MRYKLTVFGYDSGLNELLKGVYYNPKTRTVHNKEKAKNDKLCIDAIRSSKELRNVKIDKPVVIHYFFHCKNKMRDRLNIASAFDKSFEDALQKCKVMTNDGWKDVYNVTYDFEVDKLRPRVTVVIEEVENEPTFFDWSIYDTERIDSKVP